MRAIAFVLLAACGAQPNQPVLANAPRPNPAAVAGGAAAAAAAITLASPDSHNPEKKQDQDKKPIKVKENVPAGVLDRLDNATPASGPAQPASAGTKPAKPAEQPAGVKPAESKPPRDALDFGGKP
ncbi:MAG TPA: hypothetical protein VIV11_42800 [Kofleriaceae bacterium]